MSMIDRLAAEQSFRDETFVGLDLQSADLSGKDFFRCTFRNTKLQESRWKRTSFEDCVFEDCDLTRMRPDQTTAVNVRFVGSKLMGIDWSGLSPNPVLAFESCDLRYASFVSINLRKTTFRDCKAAEANFIEVDLAEADFSGTDLTGANFERANLSRANLTTAEGAFLDPAKNRVKDARVPVETAVLLATFLGMRVAGYGGEDEEPAPRRGKRR